MRWDRQSDRWFNAGVLARERGFARVSPYYEDDHADLHFFAGYDSDREPRRAGQQRRRAVANCRDCEQIQIEEAA